MSTSRALRVTSSFIVALLVLTTVLNSSTSQAITVPWDPVFASPMTVADFGTSTRPFGLAGGDFDTDGSIDLVVGQVSGRVAFVGGNGDGTFKDPVLFPWKQTFFNAWAFAAADINSDSKLDLVWGATALSSGCTVSPVPITGCPETLTVNDGDLRVWLGNGDGTFQEEPYFVSGVRHNAGILLARPGTHDAASLAVADVDGDGDPDIVVGTMEGSNAVVRLLRHSEAGFVAETLISQPAGNAAAAEPISWPPGGPDNVLRNSPWGLALSDADGDGDVDLWVADRALYVYLYRNNGAGSFTLQAPNTAVAGRPNVYLGHDAFRAAVGFTSSLGSGDINGDGKADVVLGLQSGAQTPTSNTPHDGTLLFNGSTASGHAGSGALADIGTMARGVTVVDVNGDGFQDILAAEFNGTVKLLPQLQPRDTDGDGISDYVDNAPNHANAPRIDMNTDQIVNYQDQLDNDFDTVLGIPQDPSTWQRLGDPADDDDDNDGILDTADNCVFVSNNDQSNVDEDTFGDACDSLDNRDPDDDGVPTGPLPGDLLYDAARDAKIKWSTGTTHFVIRIDALGRFFQNEFVQLMVDAATLSASDWEAKCWGNYGAGDPPDPCGTGEDTPDRSLTLPGGQQVPVSLVVIPKQLWTDPAVIDWIDDRNANPLLEIAQHGTYHVNNVPLSDWQSLPDRNFFSCETCGLSEAEVLQLLRVGHDTLLGNYSNKWLAESGATSTSKKIDWSDAAHPLLSYSPPFNASDTESRKALAQLGFKAFSASVFEESGDFGPIFSPEGSHHEQFDQFGMFHASADIELEPPDTTGDTYNVEAYNAYLSSQTDAGGLTTWLIEEVEWSGRPCNNEDRLGTCDGESNRENNTVYRPRWDAWLQVLDFVKHYPGAVVMTLGEVALASGYDNAPTVPNVGQADTDHDGIGDVIDGAMLVINSIAVTRNQTSALSATLTNGAGDPIRGQSLAFTVDADGDGADEHYSGRTDNNGSATVNVTATRAVGSAPLAVFWDGIRLTANTSATVTIADTTQLTLAASNPTRGQVTDAVSITARLVDSDGLPLPEHTVAISIGFAAVTGLTDAGGQVSVRLVLQPPVGATTLMARFAGAGSYLPSSATGSFTVAKEDTQLALTDAIAVRSAPAQAVAALTEADGVPLQGKTVKFYVNLQRDRFKLIGTAITAADGVASIEVPRRYTSHVQRTIRAVFEGDELFVGSQADALTYRSTKP